MEATAALAKDAQADAELPARAAEDYLRLVGVIAMAFSWCRAVRVADKAHAHKRQSACYFYDHVLVDAGHWLARVQAARHVIPMIDVG